MPGNVSAALASATAVCAAAWAVRGKSSAVFAPSVWRGKPGRKAIALTFDDGPSRGTPELLRALAAYSVPATFFLIGSNVEDLPDIARATAAAGHEIGNHSYSHPNFALTRPTFIETEFQRAQNAIESATHCSPRYLRAPYGVRWLGFRGMQRRLGLTGAMWSIIGRDWKLPAAAISQRVLSRVTDGDIICLHDGRGTLKDSDIGSTIEAVRRIVPSLLDRGYHFETVSQLLCPTK